MILSQFNYVTYDLSHVQIKHSPKQKDVAMSGGFHVIEVLTIATSR